MWRAFIIYEINFFNTDLFKRLVIPFSGGSTLKLTDTEIENRTFIFIGTDKEFNIYIKNSKILLLGWNLLNGFKRYYFLGCDESEKIYFEK